MAAEDYFWDDALTVPAGVDYVAGLFKMLVDLTAEHFPPTWDGVCYKRRLTESALARLYCIYNVPPATKDDDPACMWHVYPLTDTQTRLVGYCFDPMWEPFCEAVVSYFDSLFPTKGESRGRAHGVQGSTQERVAEARSLIEAGVPKTKACKRAGTDVRTYARYVEDLVDWGPND